jgi:RNA polymerase sigma-70 factor (ECF subfamily)
VGRDFFRAGGSWKAPPRHWPGDPQAALENREFWQVLENCLSKLPRGLAAAFAMRELEEMETRETCQALGITATNLFVRLHRARLMLRQCLEQNWFAPQR